MISDDELLGLPDDPELGLIVLDDKLRDKLREVFQSKDDVESIDAIYKYMQFVRTFAIVHKITIVLPSIPNPGTQSFSDMYKKYLRNLDDFNITKRIEYTKQIREEGISVIQLEPSEKVAIHNHITRIREIIENSGLASRKKNALLTKLNVLATEVDRAGTRTDMFLGLYLDAFLALGRGAEYAKPFFDEVKSLIKVIGRAKARDEGVALPPVDEAPLLGEE